MNFRKIDGNSTRAIVPAPAEYPRPAIAEPVVGEYYGRPATKSAVARTYYYLLKRQRWLILAVFVLVLGGGMAWVLSMPPQYRAAAEILVTPIDRARQSENIASNITDLTHTRSVATEMKLLKSPDFLDAAFALVPRDLRVRGFDTSGIRLDAYPVEITSQRETDVIRIEVTAGDANAAAALANSIVRANQQRHLATTQEMARQATLHVTEALTRCDHNLRTAWHQYAAVKRRYGIGDISTDQAAEAQGLANLESSAIAAEAEMQRARAAKSMLEKELKRTSTTIVTAETVADNPVVKTIDDQIERLHQDRAQLLQEYRPNAPEIRAVDRQIEEAMMRKQDALKRMALTRTTGRNPLVDSLTQNYIDALVAEQEAQKRFSLSRSYAGRSRGRIARLPAAEEQLALLMSTINELQNSHQYLTSQQESLELSLRSGGLPSVMSISNARAPVFPVSPNVPASLAILFVLACLLAIGAAVLRDGLDERLHTPEAVESFTGQRVLVSLPPVKNGFRGLVTDAECPASLLESFRILRGNLLFSSALQLPQVIMVTSAQVGEGKSTTAANLAATLAMSGKPTLIIDCDMRHPSQHLIYRTSNVSGLSDVLLGAQTLEQAIQQTPMPHLDLLPAGKTPPFPPELLAAEPMAQLLSAARTQYSYVVLDSTPLVNLSDAPIVATYAEGVLLVTSSDRTRIPDMQQALRALEGTGTPILGIVINRAEEAPALRWSTTEQATQN